MGGVVGIFLCVYGARGFSRNLGMAPTSDEGGNFIICYGCIHVIFDYEARCGVAFNAKHVLVPLRSNRVLWWGYNLSKCLGYLELLGVQRWQVDGH